MNARRTPLIPGVTMAGIRRSSHQTWSLHSFASIDATDRRSAIPGSLEALLDEVVPHASAYRAFYKQKIPHFLRPLSSSTRDRSYRLSGMSSGQTVRSSP